MRKKLHLNIVGKMLHVIKSKLKDCKINMMRTMNFDIPRCSKILTMVAMVLMLSIVIPISLIVY